MPQKYDFSGWATKNDLKCSDGRIIRRDAFKEQNGQVVPLVWMHMHDAPTNVLGHALLENRPEGTYCYGIFNETDAGQVGKELVRNKDIVGLSIYANKLKQNGPDVIHGSIKEVSLVIAGANPGAKIDNVLEHGEDVTDEMVLELVLEHDGMEYEEGEVEVEKEAEEVQEEPEVEKAEEEVVEEKEPEQEIEHKDETGDKRTVQDVIDTMTDEQKNVMFLLMEKALEYSDENEGEDEMKHNAFENTDNRKTLSHADMQAIVAQARRSGSLKDAFTDYVEANFMQHDDEDPVVEKYGLENIDVLFPDAKAVQNEPVFIKRDTGWVGKFLNGAKHTPFSRVKSMYADITEDDARARGYIKGKLKKEEVFPLFKRVTTPTTIYKKQKFDRDDIIDIDFDAIPWIKSEMRMMLNEEIARAGLVGDGRLASSDDKINEDNIRPIYKDTVNQVYAFNVPVAQGADDDATAKNFMKAIIKARKDYRGTGSPTLFTTTEMLTNMLLLEDGIGHTLYDEASLARKLRVKEIVEVPVMENTSRTADGFTFALMGIVVNPVDYVFGADKGGNVAMFDDFDIDYNQMKYLIETRCSGALVVPKSAMVVELKTEGVVSA